MTSSTPSLFLNSYVQSESGERRALKIGLPEKKDGYWQVEAWLEKFDERPGFVHGEDPVQAILLAFERIRRLLDRAEEKYYYEGTEPIYCVFPRMVPFAYGSDVTQRIEDFIDSEVKAWNEAVEARSPRKSD